MDPFQEYKIQDVKSFLERLPNDAEKFPWGYRGQADISWPLLPKLYRIHIVNNRKQEKASDIGAYRELLKLSLAKFKAYALPYIETVPATDIAWLALAQHYGLPTHLLDWSESPLVALFFALREKDKREQDAVVWAILIRDNALLEEPQTLGELDETLSEKSIIRYYPSHTTPRIAAQQGFFTVQPMEEGALYPLEQQIGDPVAELANKSELWGDVEKKRVEFIKYRIPAEHKAQMWKQLRILGITYHTVFPDIDGIARMLTEDVAMEHRW